jgi:hypothetical protein
LPHSDPDGLDLGVESGTRALGLAAVRSAEGKTSHAEELRSIGAILGFVLAAVVPLVAIVAEVVFDKLDGWQRIILWLGSVAYSVGVYTAAQKLTLPIYEYLLLESVRRGTDKEAVPRESLKTAVDLVGNVAEAVGKAAKGAS